MSVAARWRVLVRTAVSELVGWELGMRWELVRVCLTGGDVM